MDEGDSTQLTGLLEKAIRSFLYYEYQRTTIGQVLVTKLLLVLLYLQHYRYAEY